MIADASRNEILETVDMKGRIVALVLLCLYSLFAIWGAFHSAQTTDTSRHKEHDQRLYSSSQNDSVIDWERCKRDWSYAKSTKTLEACQKYLDATGDYGTITSWVVSLIKFYCVHPPIAGTEENRIFMEELKYAAEDAGKPEMGYRNVAGFASATTPDDAPLTVNTDGSASFLIRFFDINRQQIVMDYFIPVGQTAHLRVPIGSYEVRYVSGDTWYGDEFLFGPGSSYYKADRILTFGYNHSYTLTLYRVRDGNLKTRTISAESFGMSISLGE